MLWPKYRHDRKLTANYELENDFLLITLLNPEKGESTHKGDYPIRYKIKGKVPSNSSLSLYYDLDNKGYSGTKITSFNLNGHNRNAYLWEITKNPPKEYDKYYYIYALLEDTSSYSPGKVKFLVDNNKGGSLSLEDGTKVEIKKGVVAADSYALVIKKLEDIKEKDKLYVISQAKENLTRFKQIDYNPLFNSTLREFLVTHNEKEVTFNKDIKGGITLTIPYSKEIKERYNEDNLRIFYLDEEDKLFKIASLNQKIDKEKNLITVIVDHLSIYMILAKEKINNFNNFTTYPNPFNPLKEKVFTFTPLPDTTTKIKIYDLQARLVKTLTQDKGEIVPGSHAVWDGRNDYQRVVAEGIYFYLIISEEGNYSGKIAVEK